MNRNNKIKTLIGILSVFLFAICFIGGKKITFSQYAKDYKDYIRVEDDDEKIDGTDYVTFDAFFLKDTDGDGEAEGYRGSRIINRGSDKLYFELKILGDVTLKDAKIEFDSSNVVVSGTVPRSSIVPKSEYSSDFKTITLNSTIGNGISSFFYLNVSPRIDKDLNKYIGNNKVIFTGTVVDNITGEEKHIQKDVTYLVDSYSEYLNANVKLGNNTSEYNFTVTYNVYVEDTYDSMPIYESHLEGTVSDLMGEHPTSVRVSALGGNAVVDYDPETQKFTAYRRATIEDGVITNTAYNTKENGARTTKWTVTVTYPVNDNVKKETVTLNTKAWYVGIADKEYTLVESNKKEALFSHEITKLVPVTPGLLDESVITVGQMVTELESYYVDKSPIMEAYNSSEDPDNYTFNQNWTIRSWIDSRAGGKAVYTDRGNGYDDYITTKSIRISDMGVSFFKQGIVEVRNAETNELLFVVNSENKNKDLELPEGVKRVKLVTNELDAGHAIYLYVSFVKQFNVKKLIDNVPESTMAAAQSIQTKFEVYQDYLGNGDYESTALPRSRNAVFDVKSTYVKIELDKSSYEREISDSSIPMTMTITPNSTGINTRNWTKGTLLVKLPEEILDANNVEATSTIYNIINTEVVKIGDNNFIKIMFDNDNNYGNAITVSLDAVINPKMPTQSLSFTLYGYSEGATLYRDETADIYDINGNGLTNDTVAKATTSARFTAPNEVITGSLVTDYESSGEETISPLVADINPLRGSSDATMNIFVLNNSDTTVKNISIIGKVGFVGNTYQIGEGTLGTEYDSTMAGPIVIPSELEGKVQVLYSEQENPTSDISDLSNGWITTPADYQNIKSYYIIVDDDVELDVREELDFSYPIKLPVTTANLNKVSYYTHGAYFDYITDAGTHSSNVSGQKIGLRLARKYNVDLDVYKSFSDNKVPNGVYFLTDSDGNTRSINVDSNGHALVEGLYVDKTYTLKQYSAIYGYQVDEETKTFGIANGENDVLVLSNTGNYRNITLNNDATVSIDLDQEILHTLDLHNFNVANNEDLPNAIFKVTGKNHENGTNIRTDENGHAYLNNMVLGEVYKISQVQMGDYSPISEFEVRLVRSNSTHEPSVTTKQEPTVAIGTCNSQFNASAYSSISMNSKTANNQTGGDFECNATIDLSNFTSEYRIGVSSTLRDIWNDNGTSTYKLYVTSGIDDLTDITPSREISKANYTGSNTTSAQNISMSGAVNVAINKNNNVEYVPFEAGHLYNVKLQYHRSSNLGSSAYYNPSESTSIGVNRYVNGVATYDKELAAVAQKTNVAVESKNENITQSVRNYALDSNDNPVLALEIPTKVIDKALFEVSKVDSTTGDLLPGAQFKISGPGLPEGGKYITTDSNGKATVELRISYSGNTYLIPGLSGNYPTINTYTLKEVYAPAGYSIDSQLREFKLDAKINTASDITYTVNGNFEDSTYEENKFKVAVEDYPLFKVTKSDEENGNRLPNTYYAIFYVKPGTTDLVAATDIYGKTIGEKIVIDDTEYYVVKTDENGELSLNLKSGSYVLKEIQAADEKYDISDETVYFSIGESKPAVQAGVKFVSADMLPSDEPFRLINTADNGVLAATLNYPDKKIVLVKYDSSAHVEWSKEYDMTPYDTKYIYTNESHPGEIIEQTVNTFTSCVPQAYLHATEEEDYYYIAVGKSYVLILDKEGNEVDLTNPGSTTLYYYYGSAPKNPNSTYGNYYLIKDDDENYHNQYTYTMSYPNAYKYSAFDSNSNGFVKLAYLSGRNSNSIYALELDNGEFVTNETNHGEVYVVKYDKEGNSISAFPVMDKMYDKLLEFYTEQLGETAASSLFANKYYYDQYEPYPEIRYLDDNTIEVEISLYIGGSQYMVVGKFDASGNALWAKPVIFNKTYHSTPYIYGNGVSNESIFNFYDDGSFDYITSAERYTDGMFGTSTSNVIDIDAFKVQTPDEPSKKYQIILAHFDANGTLSKIIEVSRYNAQKLEEYDTSNDYKRVNYGGRPEYTYKLDDGYIFILNGTFEAHDVILRSGEKVHINSGNYILIYKVNNDSSVEWIKQYKYPISGNASSYTGFYYDTNTNRISIPLTSSSKTIQSVVDEYPYATQATDFDTTQLFVTFELSDEVLPETPAAVSLELFNKRKKFNINIESNAGGSYKVANGNDTLYEGNDPYEVETVKYGDDTTNTITITPDVGYYVKDVKVNGKSVGYNADEDGIVTLDKLTNVTENKNIVVTFALGSSKVIVHHYLKNTTIKIDSDEIMAGQIGDEYITEPKISTSYDLVKDSNGDYLIPDNYRGFYAQDNIEVIYNYENPTGELVVNYRLENTDTNLADELREVHEIGYNYITNPIQIALYELVGHVGDESGILEKPLTEIIYYYAKLNKGLVITKYIDEETGDPIADEDQAYYDYGETYTATALNSVPAPYVLSRTDGEVSGEVDDEITTITYYFKAQKGIVTTRYIDQDTNQKISDEDVQEIVYGSSYTAPALDPIPTNYRLVSTPDNATGPVETDNITVTYYYVRKDSNVIARYINPDTEETISEDIVTPKKYGDTYTTSPLANTPTGYKLKGTPSNATGTVDKDEIIVLYEYVVKDAKVITKLVDIDTGKDIKDPIISIQKWFTPYKVDKPVTPSGYELTELPSNIEGTVNKDIIEVTFGYKKIEDLTTVEPNKEDTKINNPITLDDIMLYVGIFAVSTLSITAVVVMRKKRK